MLPTGFHFFERGWLSCNNLLLVSDSSAVLIDSSYGDHAPQTLALIRHVLGVRTLDRLLNTHLHSDHCGGNALLQSHYPVLETWIPPGQAAAVTSWDPNALSYAPTGQDCSPFSWTHLLPVGSTLQTGDSQWEVHAAPGHDPHAVMLFEPAHRILLSADALWKQGFGVVFPELDGLPAFDAVADTLDLIERLNPRLVLPGHGPGFAALAPALSAARLRLERFVQQPERHRQHALKVLLKFKLLACGVISPSALLAWAQSTPYFSSILAQGGMTTDTQPILLDMLGELESKGALRQAEGLLYNT